MTDTTQGGDDKNIWNRLRRRKVVQWGIAYVAGSWGFLQGLEYVSGLLHWPDHVQKIAGLALLVGLPIALVLAWYHGDRGEQRVRGPELAIITLLFLAGGGLFWWYGRTANITQTGDTAAATSSTKASSIDSDTRPSIAVLPFDNRSKLEDDIYFVDGIHDDILTQLAKISALKVISRTSVEQFRDSKLAVRDIASQLGVKSVLEGGVQRAGDRVRITVQLIDAVSDAHLWAETYDRELTTANIFAIQSELASSIATALQTRLSPTEVARIAAVPTQSLEAWEAYQFGKQRMDQRTGDALVEAERSIRRAIELDQTFALAHVALADVVRLQSLYGGANSSSALAAAEASVTTALKLDPDSGEAWTSAGGIAWQQGKVELAEARFRRAIELNPGYTTAHHWYGLLLAEELGRPDEARAQLEQAVGLNPRSPTQRLALSTALEQLGQFTEAEQQIQVAMQVDANDAAALSTLAPLKAYAFGNMAECVSLQKRAMTLEPNDPGPAYGLAQCLLDIDDERGAFDWAVKISERWPTYSYMDGELPAAYLYHSNAKGAIRAAADTFDIFPRVPLALAILRDDDLARGSPTASVERFRLAYPELFGDVDHQVDRSNVAAAVDLAVTYDRQGDDVRASQLLERVLAVTASMPRLGYLGFGITDVRAHALLGESALALKALRRAHQDHWRGPFWRYFRDFDPALNSVRNDPEFKAIFADIERDMAKQRAALAARPKDAPLEHKATGT